MILRLLIFLFLSLYTANIQANTEDSAENSFASTKRSYNYGLQLGLSYKALELKTLKANGGQDVEISPTTPSATSLSFASRDLGLYSSIGIGESRRRDEAHQVQTDVQDFQVRFFQDAFAVELIYQNYKGFNQSPASDGASFISPDEQRLEDLQISFFQAQFSWAYKGENILKTFGSTWERPQIQGAGYFLSAGYNEIKLSYPGPFLPQGTDAFGYDKQISSGVFRSLYAGPALGYIFQWPKAYIAITGAFFGGVQRQDYQSIDFKSEENKLYWGSQFKIAWGYDWGRYFVSIIGHYNMNHITLQQVLFDIASSEMNFAVGTRF